MTEDQLEQEALGWMAELGYEVRSGYDIAPDGANPQRANHRQVTGENEERMIPEINDVLFGEIFDL